MAERQPLSDNFIRHDLHAYYNSSQAYLQDLQTHNEAYLEQYLAFISAWVKPGALVLELGCGTGAGSAFLRRRGYRAIGCDFSELFLRQGGVKETPLMCGDAFQLPVADHSVEAVCSTNFIEHVPDAPKCLHEMWRVLQPGGRLLLSSPNLCSPFFPLGDFLNLLKGGPGRPVFAQGLVQASKWLGHNTRVTLGKWLMPGSSRWRYRQPDLTDLVVGGDADSVYLACPIDLERYFRSITEARILQLSTGGRRLTQLIAKFAPRWAPFIGLVVEKRRIA